MQFIAGAAYCPVDRLHPGTTLFGDLGLDGDDASDLLVGFSAAFGVDMKECRLERHFGPEGYPLWSLFGLLAPAYWLLLAFRRGTPEQRARLVPITIADLVRCAECGRWLDAQGFEGHCNQHPR